MTLDKNMVEHIRYEYFQQFVTDANRKYQKNSVHLTGNALGIAK